MRTIYASPTGSGDGSSPSAPMGLASAKSAVRAEPTDVEVVLRGGVYELAAPLSFVAADSGGIGKTVRWRAYGGESPIFSGALHVTGWTLHDAGRNIWRAPLPPGTVSRNLWVNAQRCVRARYLPATFTSFGGGVFITDEPALPTFARPQDLEFSFTPWTQPWEHARLGIDSVTRVGNRTTFTATSHWAWGWGSWPTTPTWIENAYEFLGTGSKGQWYLNTATATLYYVPRDGEDMATADVRLAVLERLIAGDVASPLANVEFSGISFQHTTWLWPLTNKVAPDFQANVFFQAAAGADVGTTPPGAVDLPAAQNVSFTSPKVEHVGTAGIAVGVRHKRITPPEPACSGITVEFGTFSDLSSCALIVGSFAGDYVPNASDVLIQQNAITGAAAEYLGGVGILVGFASTCRVLHNGLSDLPYTAISFGWGWDAAGFEAGTAHDNEIGWNLIHGITTTLLDGGAIYTLGKQTSSTVHDNYIYDVGGGGMNNACLYPDQGSQDWTYTSNVCVRTDATPYAWFHANGAGTTNITGSSNYATTGLARWASNGANIAGIDAATGITGVDPAGWPAGPRSIAAEAGPDVTAPTVTGFDVPPSPHTSTSVAVTVTATDAAGVTGYAVTVDTTNAPTDWRASGVFSIELGEGTHTLRAYARDAAGNVSDPYPATIEIVIALPAGVAPMLMRGTSPVKLMRGNVEVLIRRGTA